MKYGLARFWNRFKNWLWPKPEPSEPLRFLCGSEEELRRITTWVCHLYPSAFEKKDEETNRFFEVTLSRSLQHHLPNPCILLWYLSGPGRHCSVIIGAKTSEPLLEKWGDLIFKHNAFTGTEWIRSNPPGIAQTSQGRYILRPKGIIPRYQEQGATLNVTVLPPSPQEQAEALLSLSEWLEGKVNEQEKRELLQLSDTFAGG